MEVNAVIEKLIDLKKLDIFVSSLSSDERKWLAEGFSSHISSCGLMFFIASSLFPCTAPWVCICLGGVQGHPGDPTSWVAALGESPLRLFTPHRESHQDV